jgi:hypothetical protein
MASLPRHADDGVPDPERLSARARAVWDQLGVIVELGPADGYGDAGRSGPATSAPDGECVVTWRVHRPARLWIWRRGAAGVPTLHRTVQADIVDEHSREQHMVLSDRAFGEQGGALVFDESGAVTKIVRNDTSGLGAFADAVVGVPAAVSGGVEAASKITTGVTTAADATADRRLASLKREKELRELELEQRGLAATPAEVAEVKRLQEQVELHNS